ncbi:MAG: TonB family protein [Pelovirga sp.]
MEKLLPHTQTRRLNHTRLLLFSLLLSLLLHLVLVLSLPTERSTQPRQEYTTIDLVDARLPQEDEQPDPQPSYEIDQQPLLPEPELDVESPRRAERDQRVEREQAPEGDDSRDQRSEPRTVPPPITQPAESEPPEIDLSETEEPVTETSSPPATTAPVAPPVDIQQPRPAEEVTETPPLSVPQPAERPTDGQQREPSRLTRDQLFPSPSKLAEIAQGQESDRDRIREREDTEIGNEVWLNLQHDRLVSFFRRFHDRIERVWNYPAEAARDGVEGTLELLIIVTREGELIDVDLRRSSGSDLLDYEAIQAVYRAAPFGPLGRHYPHEELRIRAHFRYRISGRYIFGR